MCRFSSSTQNNFQIPTPRGGVRTAGKIIGIISDGLGSHRTIAGRITGSAANGLKEGAKPFGPQQKQKSKDFGLDDRNEALAIHNQGREFGVVGEREDSVVKSAGGGEGLAEKGFWDGRETFSQHGGGMIV